MSHLSATLTLRVPADLRDELEQLAAAENRKPSDLHRLLLEEALAARRARETKGARV